MYMSNANTTYAYISHPCHEVLGTFDALHDVMYTVESKLVSIYP
jgi:hypothetical protein